jgi:hypothetical protein
LTLDYAGTMNENRESKRMSEAILAAGWGAEEPCAECVEALKRPWLPGHLRPMDALGIHWHQVVVHLTRRFGSHGRDGDADWGKVERIAFLHVMRAERATGELTIERLRAAYEMLMAWLRESYEPASRRLEEALRLGHDFEWWREHGPEYDPAFTDSLLTYDQGFTDTEYDLKALALAKAMHEENTLTPSQAFKTSIDELIAHIDFLGEYPLWRYTADGKVRLDPKKVKTGLDGKIGRLQDRCSAEKDAGAEWLEPADASALGTAPEAVDPMSALASMMAVENVRRLEAARVERLGEAREAGAAWHVLTHLYELLEHEMTQTELAEESGFSPSSINEALKAEARAILRLLDAA